MIIDRPFYLNKAIAFRDSGLIKLFIGQRRVGKSYMLFQMMKIIHGEDKNANLVYINKEHPDFQMIRDEKSLTEYIDPLKKNRRKLFVH